VARKQAEGSTAPAKLRNRRTRPPVGSYPVLWKERHAQTVVGRSRLGRIAVVLSLTFLLLAIFAILLFIFHEFARGSRLTGSPRLLGYLVNFWMRTLGTVIVCGMLIHVALRAAASITAEREQQTLDALLTTPLENRTILLGKWLGSILSLRWPWMGLGLFWVAGVCLGGLHLLAVPLLLLAWWIYAAFVANLGLWWSVISPVSQRATFGTFFSILLIAFGHWGVYAAIWALTDADLSKLMHILTYGFTPPITLGFLAFSGEQLIEMRTTTEDWQNMTAALAGLACYSVAALVLWMMTKHRFAKLTNRGRILQPEVSQLESKEPMVKERAVIV
jgi:hypothetical protein